jgi:hypothetical protein
MASTATDPENKKPAASFPYGHQKINRALDGIAIKLLQNLPRFDKVLLGVGHRLILIVVPSRSSDVTNKGTL